MRVLRLIAIMSLLASVTTAQHPTLQSPERVATSERRAANIQSLIAASRKLTTPPDGPSVRYAFVFGGPTIDEDLSRFYSFFATRYPEALEPIEVRSDLVAQDCKAASDVCDTLSHAAFAYGLLARDFPPGFEKGVLVTLQQRFHVPALPGLPVTTIDIPQRRWLPSYGEKVARSVDKKVICGEIRFDGQDCILGTAGNYVFVNGQALQVTIVLPANRKDELIGEYLKRVQATNSYHQQWQSFFEVRPATVESRESELDTATDFDFESADPDVLEASNFQGFCGEAPIAPNHLITREQLVHHITAYRRQTFPDGTPSVTGLQLPFIVFFDRFSDGPRQKSLTVGVGLLDHPDLRDAPLVSADLCLEQDPQQVPGHGLFGLGLLTARRNGVGIVGLLPDYNLSRIKAIDVENNSDLQTLLPEALKKSLEDGNTAIANISLSVGNDDQGNSFELFKKIIRGTEKNVLYIAAAGQPKSGPPQLWKDACQQVFPCLGDEPNVIVVGALDHVRQDHFTSLWPFSNYSPRYVTVAAPGVDIISIDRRHTSPSDAAYSIRSGTSESTIFVTAVAARLLAQNPGLSPELLKQRILSRTMPLEVARSGNVRYLFGGDGLVGVGDPASIATGALVNSTAMTEVPGQATVFLDNRDKPLKGSLRFAPDLGGFVVYRSVVGGAAFEINCPVLGIRRLSRRAANQYSLYCVKDLVADDNTSVKRVNLFYDSHFLIPEEGESPMSCLYRPSGCVSLVRADTQEVVPIDLRSVLELYVNSASH